MNIYKKTMLLIALCGISSSIQPLHWPTLQECRDKLKKHREILMPLTALGIGYAFGQWRQYNHGLQNPSLLQAKISIPANGQVGNLTLLQYGGPGVSTQLGSIPA